MGFFCQWVRRAEVDRTPTRELRRLSEYDAACLVVEADLQDVLGNPACAA